MTTAELNSKIFTPPSTAKADVAVRRLQRFQIKSGDKIRWTFGKQKGEATVGNDGLLNVGRLSLSTKPEVLTISKASVNP